MDAFLAETLALPTVIFTILLGLTLVYWLTVIAGVLDLDALDGTSGAVDAKAGALDGALEAKAGALDGALEANAGTIEGALEAKAGAVDGLLSAKEGLLDGAAEAIEAKAGGIDGAAEALEAKAGALDALDAEGAALDAAGMAAAKVRARVPATIRFSLWALAAWVTSFLLIHNLALDPLDAGVVVSLGAVLGASVIGWLFSRVASAPLSHVFDVPPAPNNSGLVGTECVVTTGWVDHHFGQARVEDGGAGLVIHVRCEPGRLARGDEAIIVEFDAGANSFVVTPTRELLGPSDA